MHDNAAQDKSCLHMQVRVDILQLICQVYQRVDIRVAAQRLKVH